jgi:hypothetical protein
MAAELQYAMGLCGAALLAPGESCCATVHGLLSGENCKLCSLGAVLRAVRK